MDKQKLYGLSICLSSMLFLFGCSRSSGGETKQAEPPKEFAAMLAKKDELSALPTIEKLSKKPAIKGKIAIVSNHDGDTTLDRFADDGSTFFTDPTIAGETYNSFLPAELYAKHPDEIQTLIKINCVTKKAEALYSDFKTEKEEMKFYQYVICDLGLIDYKTATVIAKKQVGKNEPPKVINNRTVARTPWIEIIEFLSSFPNAEQTAAPDEKVKKNRGL